MKRVLGESISFFCVVCQTLFVSLTWVHWDQQYFFLASIGRMTFFKYRNLKRWKRLLWLFDEKITTVIGCSSSSYKSKDCFYRLGCISKSVSLKSIWGMNRKSRQYFSWPNHFREAMIPGMTEIINSLDHLLGGLRVWSTCLAKSYFHVLNDYWLDWR
jgi:hypothetical protein